MGVFHNSEPFDGLFDLNHDGRLDFLERSQRDTFFWDDENNNDSRNEDDFDDSYLSDNNSNVF